MGQCPSSAKRPRLPAFLTPSRKEKSPLSAAFNMMDSDTGRVDHLLDVNLATEEELMTLPGVNRVVARNIVEYRHAIGGFKKVEDIALVSGIGAEKLDLVRPEICVTRMRKNLSRTSSLSHSVDSTSVPSSDSNCRGGSVRGSPSVRLVNVNKATVFDLMAIHGVNQELAASIVEYRDRKGLFRNINDLLRVRGLNYRKLGAIRSCFLLEDAVVCNGVANHAKRHLGHRRSSSAPVNTGVGDSLDGGTALTGTDDTCFEDVFELLSVRSRRPITTRAFRNVRDNRKAFRVATWNLGGMGEEKAANPGVMEVICRTVMENGFSLIALQEVCNEAVLKKICDELNQPTLHQTKKWDGPRGDWKYAFSSPCAKLGVIYDSSYPLSLTAEAVGFPGNNNNNNQETAEEQCEAFVTTFKVMDVTLTLLNINLRRQQSNGPSLNAKSLQAALQSLQGPGKTSLAIAGSFPIAVCNPDSNGIIGQMSAMGFQTVVSGGSSTSVMENTDNPSEISQQNIGLSPSAIPLYTGHSGLVRQGLSHLAIPNGWTLGGSVSSHCPVWAEFYCQATTSVNGIVPMMGAGGDS